jgi:hypothetical protein
LVESNPALAQAGAEAGCFRCDSDEIATVVHDRDADGEVDIDEVADSDQKDLPEDDAADDLDDLQPGPFLCRWPNGESSIVVADSKRDAIVQLDEWAGAQPAERANRS